MPKIIEICSTEGSNLKNTGSKGQKFTGHTVKYLLSKSNKTFDKSTMKTKADFKAKLKSKELVIFYDVEKVENANTEPSYIESSLNKKLGKKGIKIKKFRHELGTCSYDALESYAGSEYTQIHEITSENYVLGVAVNDTLFKGQTLKEFIVGDRVEATAEEFEHCFVEAVYKDAKEFTRNPAIIEPKFDIATELEGIFDVRIEVLSANATTIEFKVLAGCCNDEVSTLQLADFEFLKSSDGTSQSLSALSFVDNKYTLTGTGFETGTLATKGVVEDVENLYESEPTTVTI